MREPPGPVWGRAVSCCLWPHGCSGRRVACCRAGLLGVPVGGGPLMFRCCLWPHGCSGRRVVCCRAGLLVVPVGGGPPASRPRRELRSARRPEARPGPATAHGHRSQALRSLRRPPHLWGFCGCCCVARRLEARPGPAAAHRHCGWVVLTFPVLQADQTGCVRG